MERITSTISLAVIGVSVVASLLMMYLKWRLRYWQRKKILSLEASVPFGSLENLFTTTNSVGVQYKTFHHKLKKLGAKFGGMYAFLTPALLPIDLDCVKLILTKDFQNFHARGFFSNPEEQPEEANLVTVDGSEWRKMRTKFTPMFTSVKMKAMLPIMVECSAPMREHVAKHASNGKPVDARYMFLCFTADVIGSCAFGLNCNSYEDDRIVKKVTYAVDTGTSLLKLAFCSAFQGLAKKLRFVLLPSEPLRYFCDVIESTVTYRETNNITRNDILQLLINMKHRDEGSGYEDFKLTNADIAAQSFLFFVGGFETSSGTMTFCLFELARNQDVQRKVREEINSVLANHDGTFTYDAISEMKYLQQVVDETLRMYPALPIINRKCTEDYKLPDSDVVIEKGTPVIISILGIHYDPEYYPDPEKFDPERFSEEQTSKRHPYAFIPFSEGPRHCIGLRFASLQMKTGLAVLLKNFAFTLNPKTVLPIKHRKKILLTAVDDILLDAKILPQ